MPRRIVLLAVVFSLATTLLLPAAATAGDDLPAPDRVADWWQWGDLRLKEKAAAIVAQATPAYLKRFQQALNQARANPGAAADRLIERARTGDPEAVTLLTGMGETAIRRLLERIPDAPLPVFARAERRGVATPAAQVLITVEVYTLGRDEAAVTFGDARGHGVHLLDRAEVEAFHMPRPRRDKTRTSAPRLLVEDRNWATIHVGDPVPYVKAYRVETKGDRRIADPVIDTVAEGLQIELRPVVSTDRRFITLEGFVVQKVLKRPIPSKKVQVPGVPGEVEVQVPTLAETKLDLHVTIPRNGSVVGTGLPHPIDETKELLVLVTPEISDPNEFADRELAVAEADARSMIHVDIRALEVSEEALVRALGPRIPHADQPSRSLTAAEVLHLLGPDRAGGPGVKIIHAPQLTTYDGQKANVTVVNQVSYIQDFELEVAKDGSQMADPIIGVIQEGLVLELTPRVSADRKAIRLDALATWADLMRPIPEFKTKIGKPGQDVTIQLPELTVLRVRDECRVAPGTWVLLGGLGEGSHGRRFILFHAKVLEARAAKGER